MLRSSPRTNERSEQNRVAEQGLGSSKMKTFPALSVVGCLALVLQICTAACPGNEDETDNDLSALSADKLLDKCEEKGRAAGALAFRAACLELTSKCPAPAALAKSAFSPQIAEDLFEDVVQRTCTTLFVLSCERRGTDNALDKDPNCGVVLNRGPSKPVEGCRNAKDARLIFVKSLEKLCSAEERVAGLANLGGSKNDPCRCAKDGISNCVDTGRKGCKRHLQKDGDNDRFCYVKGGPACVDEEIQESKTFPGAFWRLC